MTLHTKQKSLHMRVCSIDTLLVFLSVEFVDSLLILLLGATSGADFIGFIMHCKKRKDILLNY